MPAAKIDAETIARDANVLGYASIEISFVHVASVNSGFPFFRKVRGDSLGCVAAAWMFFAAWNRSVRDEKDLAGLERHRRPALERVFQHAFDDVDELFARM